MTKERGRSIWSLRRGGAVMVRLRGMEVGFRDVFEEGCDWHLGWEGKMDFQPASGIEDGKGFIYYR